MFHRFTAKDGQDYSYSSSSSEDDSSSSGATSSDNDDSLPKPDFQQQNPTFAEVAPNSRESVTMRALSGITTPKNTVHQQMLSEGLFSFLFWFTFM